MWRLVNQGHSAFQWCICCSRVATAMTASLPQGKQSWSSMTRPIRRTWKPPVDDWVPVVTACTGVAGLEAFALLQPRPVVLDVDDAEAGWLRGLAMELAQRNPDVPIVMLTALAMWPNRISRASNSRATTTSSKPFSPRNWSTHPLRAARARRQRASGGDPPTSGVTGSATLRIDTNKTPGCTQTTKSASASPAWEFSCWKRSSAARASVQPGEISKSVGLYPRERHVTPVWWMSTCSRMASKLERTIPATRADLTDPGHGSIVPAASWIVGSEEPEIRSPVTASEAERATGGW